MHLTFDHNFSKCRLLYEILSLSDFWGNFVHKYHKDCLFHLKYASTLPCGTWKLQLLLISMAYCTWDLRIDLARYEATNSSDLNPTTINFGKQCSSAQKRISDVSELKQWHGLQQTVIDEARISEWHERPQACLHLLSTYFNFRTIYQVSRLQ